MFSLQLDKSKTVKTMSLFKPNQIVIDLKWFSIVLHNWKVCSNNKNCSAILGHVLWFVLPILEIVLFYMAEKSPKITFKSIPIRLIL